MSHSPKVETKLAVLRQAMMRRVHRRLAAEGWITLPAVPGARDVYAKMFALQFESIGRPLTQDEDKHLRNVLEEQLQKAFEHSPHARIRVDWSERPARSQETGYSCSTFSCLPKAIPPTNLRARCRKWSGRRSLRVANWMTPSRGCR